MGQRKALARVEEVYENRGARSKELKAQGRKVIGYFCCYPPVELMSALGLVPYRITGSVKEPISRAHQYLETIMCPYIRSCFDKAVKGDYAFLDGVVVPHSCDTVERIYLIWNYYLRPAYSHYLNIPHMNHPSSRSFFKREIERFKRSLEEFAGREVSPEGLRQAIAAHNRNRALVRGLYELRKKDPPLLSGTEMTRIIVAAMSLPVEEGNSLLEEVLEEVRGRRDGPPRKPARVLLYGSEIDDVAFVQLVEESGANVVIDDLCLGTRYYWHDVEPTEDPIDGLAERYLDKVMCPRTYREGKAKERFGYLLDLARDFRVNGVILYIIRFCDTHEFDVPEVRDFLEGAGLPVLHLEDDYSLPTMGQLKTRIQAFLEMIGAT